MFDARITISFISDWHVGSGLGDGAIADSILNRDANGIPYIPGRAVKGALREAAWRLGNARKDLDRLVDVLFGSESEPGISNTPGRIFVGMAALPKAAYDWLLGCSKKERKSIVGDMTILRAQTQLSDRMVVAHSLRTTECGIPGIEFECGVSIDYPKLPQSWLSDYLAALCAGVRSMGADRSRGLGCCRFTLAGRKNDMITLPEALREAS